MENATQTMKDTRSSKDVSDIKDKDGGKDGPRDAVRDKAIAAALGAIEKQFGKGAIMRLGGRGARPRSRSSRPARSASTSRSASAGCRAAASSRSTAPSRRARPR